MLGLRVPLMFVRASANVRQTEVGKTNKFTKHLEVHVHWLHQRSNRIFYEEPMRAEVNVAQRSIGVLHSFLEGRYFEKLRSERAENVSLVTSFR